MKSRSNHQALVMGVAILIMAYFPLMSAQNILLSVQRQINAPRVNYIGLNIQYSCTLTYQGTTPSINEVEVDISFSGPGIQNNSNNVQLSEVRRSGNRFQRILEFNPISAQDEGSYHCNGTIVSISDMQLIGMQEQTENIMVLKPTIDISLDPVYPVAERYLDIAPYNSFSFNCSAMITVQDTSVNLQRVFSWQRTIGGSSSNISAEIFTVLSINATEAGIHTYTCTVTLDVSPAPDIITSNSSQTRTIFGPSNPAMPMNVDTPSEYLFDNRSRVQWLVSSITYDPESYVVQYRPFESMCPCNVTYMNSAQITSGRNITRVNFLLSVELSDLMPGTTYEYRVIANNSARTTLSSPRYFTTTTTTTSIPEQPNVGLAVGLSIFFIIIIIIIIIIGVIIGSRYKENLKKLEEEKQKNQEQQRKLEEEEQQRKLEEEEQKNQEQQIKLKEKEQIIQRLQETTYLHNAAKEGNLEEVKRLIAKGVDPLSKDSYDDTAIHIAAINGKLEVIKYLTEDLHCDPSLPGWHGTTPLNYAAQCGHLSIIQYLMDKHKANPLGKDGDGYLPLHWACKGGSLEVVKYLIESMKIHMSMHDILTFPTKRKSLPIHNAALKGHTNIIKYLIEECRCDPNLPGGLNGRGPLFYAAQEGHLSTVKYLIVECGCDPASTDTNQATPLHLAAQLGHLETVKYLTADRKCKPTTRNNKNNTPMHLAALYGHSDVVEYFITVMQCSPHLPGWNGRSPLHDASQKGHLHLVKNLIEKHGCDPNVLDDDNFTPLHLAAQFGHLSVVQHLTKNKDCIVTYQNRKDTPLHLAAYNNHLAIVQHLVEQARCPPNIKNDSNQTPLQLAQAMGHSEVVDYLRTS